MALLPDPIEACLSQLPKGLQQHIGRVREVGRELAQRHNADVDKVDIGIASHDLYRAANSQELLDWAARLDIHVHPVEQQTAMLLHGPVASRWIEEYAGLSDAEILESVHWHTTGREGMSELAKVVYLADKLDPHKIARYDYLENVRMLAQENLDAALIEYLSQNLAYFVREGKPIHPASVELRNRLLISRGLYN